MNVAFHNGGKLDWVCDCMGMYGAGVRERFMIFSSYDQPINSWLSAGYFAYLYHFANSEEVRGVVDNMLAMPWVKFQFDKRTVFDDLSLRLGLLQGAQNDRLNIGTYYFPSALHAEVLLRWRSIGFRNEFVVGNNMMPLFFCQDATGVPYYMQNLYFGDCFYRISSGLGKDSADIYDRLELYWNPKISRNLDLKLSSAFHLSECGTAPGSGYFGFAGWQQRVSIRYNLSGTGRKR